MTKLNKVAKGIQTAIMFGAVCSANTYAQTLAEQEAAVAVQETVAEQSTASEEMLEDEEEEKIVVTGSRIRRSEFSNASPIQVISGDLSREMGLFNAGEMLQSTNQASGVQFDNTFGGYVLDNGPGAATIGFRGLGAERTLVLVNGRRMAPAGVGGAPTAPDLNLIPGVMIQRVENLLDGASTVYGSDAVAGVANVILKNDIEGFEVQGSFRQPKGDGGEETVLSAMWGTSSDNGFFTIGAEYNETKAQSYSENPFAKGCEERIWETEDGRTIKRYSGIGPTASGEDSCDIFPLTNRIQVPIFWGSLYNTPGFTNTGIPNFSESSVPASWEGHFPNWIAADFNGDGILRTDQDGVIIDGNGDGIRDFDFQDPFYAYQQSDYYKSGDYRSKNKRLSVLLNGEYNFQDENDTTFYYEGLYAKRDSPIFNPGAQIFEWVPANNPYNPCGTNGIDCTAPLGFGDYGPQEVRPIINIRGDRDRYDIEVSQYRAVAGFTANLTALEEFGLNNWYYDIYVSHSASKGTNSTYGIDEARLLNSLNTSVLNDDGTVSCGDGSDGCVPVNLFGDNIFQEGGGTLTAAESNYLMTERYMETRVKQSIISGFIGGDIYELPWNQNVVTGIFGAEYRRDEIESDPNDVASEGLLWGYFSDQGAEGSRHLREVFTEFEMPLISGQPGIEEFTFIASGRWSEESYYDPAQTYSLKAVYRPVEWFTIRGTKGTSYRAPNLRERFLLGTSGFQTVSDPCVVPTDARVTNPDDLTAPPTYDPNSDNRDAGTIAACAASGVDPTSLGLGQDGDTEFSSQYSSEVVAGGSLGLVEETSLAKTFGFVIEQPFSDDFDLTFSLTRFDIEVSQSIAEPSYAYSINQCYSADGNDAFCSRIDRDDSGQIQLVDQSFINIGLITSKGMDYNLYYSQDFLVNEQNLGVTLDIQATRQTESLYDVLGTVDDNSGEPDYPEWRATARLQVSYDDFRFNWETRFIGEGKEDWLDDEIDGAFIANTDGCTGLTNDDGSPLLCREVAYTDDYFVHNASLTYVTDDYLVTLGVRNVFNEEPPKVDPNGSFSNTNIPLGVGYDTNGRTPYINFTASF